MEWPDTRPPSNPVWGIITPLVWCCWSRGFKRELWLPNTIHSSRVQPMAGLVRCHMLRNGGARTSICEPETKFVTEDSGAGVQLCPLLNLLWQQFLQCSPLIVMDVAQKQLIQKLIVFHWRCFSKIPQKRFKRELNNGARWSLPNPENMRNSEITEQNWILPSPDFPRPGAMFDAAKASLSVHLPMHLRNPPYVHSWKKKYWYRNLASGFLRENFLGKRLRSKD